jgi:hypothetical protein
MGATVMAAGTALVADGTLLQSARQVKDELLSKMFGAVATATGAAPAGLGTILPPGSNIVGVGYGAKSIAVSGLGGYDEIAVRVYVRAKLPQASVPSSERVPTDVNGTPTDVIPVGDLTALLRPTACGVSVGHFRITAGTLGCLATKRGVSTGDRFILSNNHVLADSNTGMVGDDILEPGPIDGGSSANPIARLSDFQPIDFTAPTNAIDAAIAQVIDVADVTPDILGGIGIVTQPPMPAALFQSVRKHGRTTRHTVGIITDLAADIRVRYGTRIAEFQDQIGILGAGGLFSSGGDSGSLIVDAVTRRPVGLLFAGGGGMTFGNPIDPILTRFDIDIL